MADESINELEVCYDRYTRLNPVIESLKRIHDRPDFPSSKLNDFADRINSTAEECTKTHRCGRFCRWFESHIRNNLAWAAELKDGSLMNSMTSAWFSLFFCMHQTPDEYCEIIRDNKYDKKHDKKNLSIDCSKSNVLRSGDFYESLDEVLKNNKKVGKAICCEIAKNVDLFKKNSIKIGDLLKQLSEIAKSNKEITIQFCGAIASLSKSSPENCMQIFDQFLFAVNQDPIANAMHLTSFVKSTNHLYEERHRKNIGKLLYDWHKNGNTDQKRMIRRLQKIIIPLLRQYRIDRPAHLAVPNCKIILHNSEEGDILIADVIDVSGGGLGYPAFGRGIHFRKTGWKFNRHKFKAKIENKFGTSLENSILRSIEIKSNTSRLIDDPKVTVVMPTGLKIPCSSYSVRAYPVESDPKDVEGDDIKAEDTGVVIFLNNTDQEIAEWKNFVSANGVEI